MLLWVSPSLKVQSWLRIEPNASSFDSVASSATLRSTYTIICFSWHKNAQQQPKHTQTSLKCKPFKITLNMCQTHVASLVIAPVWNANMWIRCPTPTVWFHKVQLFFCFFKTNIWSQGVVTAWNETITYMSGRFPAFFFMIICCS